MSPVRKIIHIDMDCFYAAVEMRDDPRLRNRPLAVGGRPDRRGVISTCNYEARAYGVHSAMASSQAIRLCPDLLIVPPRIEHYAVEARRIRAIFQDYTPRIEPLSLDEAYLDVTGSTLFQGSATRIAEDIRRRIFQELKLTASAGVAPNKFLAKIASDWRKPNGQFVIRPEQVDDFVAALPVEKLHGVGRVTAAKLHELGIRTCQELRHWPLPSLREHFGSFGQHLFQLARGIDEREVVVERVRKSVSVENTFDRDLQSLERCREAMPDLFRELVERLEATGEAKTMHKLFVKVKFSDFSQTTAEMLATRPEISRALELLDEAYSRQQLPVRLLGVGVRFAERRQTVSHRQLPLPLPDPCQFADDSGSFEQ